MRRAIRKAIANWWRPTKLRAPADYEAYRATQNAGNARKIDNIFAREANIGHLARYATRRLGRPDLRILCHGTRNGAEQRWFRAQLPDALDVLGTEIADSASRFPDTVQWDFHDIKPEWRGAWDVVYSNSWDHAFNPERAFRSWLACLKPDGIMLLEHSRLHMPDHATELDPFGATLPALRALLNQIGAPTWSVVDTIFDLPEANHALRVVVVGADKG